MKPARSPGDGAVERLLRREQVIVAVATGLLILLAGLYTVFGIGMNMSALDMTGMARAIGAPMQMDAGPDWNPGYAALLFLMWWIMMIAMMTPAAAPLLLLFSALKRQGSEGELAPLFSGCLLAGYLLAWAGFSVAATGLQWGLETAGLSDGAMMTIRSRWFAGAVMLLAGLYQFSGLKNACLSHCRAPGQFLAEHRRPGLSGALRMGLDHGSYCLGCCWTLMALLFVGGVMNLYWIVGLALYVLVEKLVPRGELIARIAGMGLIVAGLYFLVAGLGYGTVI